MKFSRIDVDRVGMIEHFDTTSSERSTSQSVERTTFRTTVDQIAHPACLHVLVVHRLGQEIQRGGDLEIHPKCKCNTRHPHCIHPIPPSSLPRIHRSRRPGSPPRGDASRTAGAASSSSLLSFQSWFLTLSKQMLAATKAIRISATSVVRYCCSRVDE